jgi:hypothetical protein
MTRNYVVVARLQDGRFMIIDDDHKPLSSAIDCARAFNGGVFLAIPAGGLTEWWCREGSKRFHRESDR